MKVAVCFSGQPRYLGNQYEKIHKTLIEPYNSDVFIHCWWDPSYIGQRFDFSPHASSRTGTWEFNTDFKVKQLYNPKKVAFEPHKNFDMTAFAGANFERQSPHILKSMWYSVNKANQLKAEYEKENAMVYDLVIRTRFDLKIESFSLDLNAVDTNKIYVSGEINPLCNDQCAFSSSKNMDIYCDLYNRLESYWVNDKLPSMVNEKVLTHHLNKNKLDIHFCSKDEMYVNILKV
jgi:hypothetical protein